MQSAGDEGLDEAKLGVGRPHSAGNPALSRGPDHGPVGRRVDRHYSIVAK
jgi:hypothetical protein